MLEDQRILETLTYKLVSSAAIGRGLVTSRECTDADACKRLPGGSIEHRPRYARLPAGRLGHHGSRRNDG
jgi:hypothetical protein